MFGKYHELPQKIFFQYENLKNGHKQQDSPVIGFLEA